MSIETIDKGLIDYQESHQEMLDLVKSTPRKSQIWHLEHFPVYTIGISEKLIKEDDNQKIPIIKPNKIIKNPELLRDRLFGSKFINMFCEGK